MSHKSNKFKNLQKEWYKKIKDAGFEDIEKPGSSHLKHSALTRAFRRGNGSKVAQDNRFEYYYRAEHFLNNYHFESNRDRIVWEYHANGLSTRSIAKILKDVNLPIKHVMVHKIIAKYRIIMNKFEWANITNADTPEGTYEQ